LFCQSGARQSDGSGFCGRWQHDPWTRGKASERASLKLLTKEDEFSETFSHLVLRFTDGTYDELKKSGSTPKRALLSYYDDVLAAPN
jgi:hypothetical protein